MGYIIGIPLLMAGLYRMILKKEFDYLTLCMCEWGTVLTLSALRLYGMFSFSDEAYIFLGVGVICFLIACEITQCVKSNRVAIYDNRNDIYSRSHIVHRYQINQYVLYILGTILTLFVIYVTLKTLLLLNAGYKMGTIHAMYLSRGNEAFFTSGITRELNSKFAVPMQYLNCALIAYMLVYQPGTHRSYIIISVCDLVLWVIATGGRLILAYLIIDLLMALSLSSENYYLENVKKRILGLITGLFVVVVFYTIFRKGFSGQGIINSLSKVIEEFYKYFSLSVPLFQHWINEIVDSNISTLGCMSFYGILANIKWFAARLWEGSFSFLDVASGLLSDTEVMVPLFQDAKCNAFVTCFFYFYADFGIIGLILGSLVFGLICGRAYRNACGNNDPRDLLLYLLLSQAVLKMFVRFELANEAYVMSFVYLLLITWKSRSKIANAQMHS